MIQCRAKSYRSFILYDCVSSYSPRALEFGNKNLGAWNLVKKSQDNLSGIGQNSGVHVKTESDVFVDDSELGWASFLVRGAKYAWAKWYIGLRHGHACDMSCYGEWCRVKIGLKKISA